MGKVQVKNTSTTMNGHRTEGAHRHNDFANRTDDQLKKRYAQNRSLSHTGFSYDKKNVVRESHDGVGYDEEKELVEETIRTKAVSESLFPSRLNEYSENGKEMLMTEALSRVYVHSLPLSQTSDYETQLRATFESFMVDGDIYKRLKEQRKKRYRTSFFIDRVERIIESIVLEKVSEKSKEAKEKGHDNIDLDFSLDSDEANKFHDDLSSIGIDQVSGAIKDKVVNVVKEERERQLKEKEELDALEDDVKNTVVVEDETVEESLSLSREVIAMEYNRLDSRIDDVRDTTLMDAMFRSNLRTVKERFIASRRNRTGHHSGIDIHIDEEELPELRDTIDMDLVFAETVANYALFETAHTLNLMEFTKDDVRNLVYKV